MSYAQEYRNEYDDYAGDGFVADAALSDRLAFMRRTYLHVFGAILAFIALAALFLNVTPIRDGLFNLLVATRGLILLGFIAVSWICHRWAYSEVSRQTQYVGLGLYVFAEAIFFTPMLWFASMHGEHVIPTAAFLTLLIFGGLTAVVLLTKSDFSFMRGALTILTLAALGLVVVSIFTQMSLGLWFCVGMIVLMSGWILYDTSQILHHFRTDQHVAAALELFASLATLFWYVLRFVMMTMSED